MRTNLKGDLFNHIKTEKFDVIVHGCNCFRTMGKGFAKQIKEVFPEAYDVDLKTNNGDRGKLGSYTKVECDYLGKKVVIVNAYTQYDSWSSGIRVNYDALGLCFKRIKKEFKGKKIAYPAIGSGLAGGDWDIIQNIIDEELKGEEHYFVDFKI